MSGAEAPLIGAAIGSGMGVLTNRKNPLQGALMGAGLGAAGGQFLPGLLPGAATKGAEAAGLGALNAFDTGAMASAAGIPFHEAGLAGMMASGLNQSPAMMARLGNIGNNPMSQLGAKMMMGGGEQQQPQQMPMPAPMISQPRQQAASPFSSLMPQDPYMQGFLNPQMGAGFQIGRGWRG